MQDPERKKLQSKRLLIIACSARKRQLNGLVSAWNTYDGVTYRVLKKLQCENCCLNDVDILIVSAKYGLIKPSTLIEYYDTKMQFDIAARQAPNNVAMLKRLCESKNYHEVFINVGRLYLEALQPIDSWLNQSELVIAKGGIGQRISQMKRWILSL